MSDPDTGTLPGANAGVKTVKTARNAPSTGSTLLSDRQAMLAIAKSLPDALKVVAFAQANAESSAADGWMELQMGLDGTSHTVPFSFGMTMEQLKEKVLGITGIPVEEQMYVYADEARLVDDDDLVPLDKPLRCVRSCPPPAEENSAQGEELSEEQNKKTNEEESEFIIDDSDKSQRKRNSWADMTDEAEACLSVADIVEDSMVWNLRECSDKRVENTQESSPNPADEEQTAHEASLAKKFTQRWRDWNESERQHQFYIAIPEHRRQELRVVQQIKKACRGIYKENVMVRLRGRGSGFLEGARQRESTDPLMICISGRNDFSLEDYWEVFYLIAALLEDELYAAYNQSLAESKRSSSDIHLDDDWVNGGVRLYGEANACSAEKQLVQQDRRPSSWVHEFVEAWRTWNPSERHHQFYIDVPEAFREELSVVSRIKNVCRDIYSERIMLRLRGRGSGFIEGRHKAESLDPLMVCLSGRPPYSMDEYWITFEKIATFLEDDIYAAYNAWIKSTGRNKLKAVHLVHSAVHGGIRKGGRANSCM